MDHGHRVDGGDRRAKTIIFARNHEHAAFLQERFDRNYPRYAGHFARVIDNTVKYAQSLIDDFSGKDSPPHIAISVDMLDTGIDFGARTWSSSACLLPDQFWQMVAGHPAQPYLFGPY
jgi:type I restriction enzyme R subunit